MNDKRRHCIALALALAVSGLSPAAMAQGGGGKKLLVLGDSLSAEYGLPRGSGWVALLQARLQDRKPPVTVINASISGDTTAGGRARLPALLKQHQPTHVVIELGGNDALRGLPLDGTEANLRAMVASAQATGAKVMLIGMQVPPNYGPRYTQDFAALFGKVAKSSGTALVPFMLAALEDRDDPLRWFQPDRIHPNQEAHPKILGTLWPVIDPWLRR